MAHNEGPRPLQAQQISNASYNTSLSAVTGITAGYTYLNVTTSAQNLVKTGAGLLGRVAINSTLVSAVRGYDNTVSGGNTLFTIPAATTATSIAYEVRFGTGLVVSSGAGADNITIMFN